MPSCLLITAAGTGTAYGYALALAQRGPSVTLVTADTHAACWVSAAIFAQTHLQVPPFDAGGYLDALGEIIGTHGVTHYLPILDSEIQWAARHRDRLAAEVIAPPAPFVDFAVAKDRYPQVLARWGIDAPRGYARHDAVFPCYAKRPGSFGSRGAWVVKNETELAGLPADAFLQELVAGPEFTVDCYPLGDSTFCSVRERVDVKAGVCTKARIAPNPELEHIAGRLVEAFDLRSPFCFQAIRCDGYFVTDVNPRLGAGTALSAANGSDFFGAHLDAVFCCGDPRDRLRRHHEVCAVTRQYVEYVSAA